MNKAGHGLVRAALVLGCVGVVACGPASSEDDVPSSESEPSGSSVAPLRGGMITLANGVVAFQISGGGYCTGTMIAPNVIVTAAHCLEVAGALLAHSGTVSLAYVDYYDPATSIRTVFSGDASWAVPSSWDGAGPSGPTGSNDDIGLIVIPGTFEGTDYHDYLRIYADSDIPLTPLLWQSQELLAYGAGHYTYEGDFDSQLRVATFGVTWLGANSVTVDMRDDAGVCHGDSGGPLVRVTQREGTNVPMVVGVLSKMQSSPEAPCGDTSEAYYCRTTPRIAWIESWVGATCTSNSAASQLTYKRCYELPFIEDAPGEGVHEQGVATAIAMATMF